MVTGQESLIAGLTPPDPDDRHILAAAIRCNASVTVTFNLKDFPNTVLESFGLEAQHPDVFIEDLFDLDPAAVVTAAQRQRRHLQQPPLDADVYLTALLRQGLARTVRALAEYRSVLQEEAHTNFRNAA